MKKSTKAMIIASRMIKLGYTRAEAMKKAWTLIKEPIETKVSGVTYERRQRAIMHLSKYSPAIIGITLERDKGNMYDGNAVSVVATVTERGSYCMGFLPKPLAAIIAPVMDREERIESNLKEITGGFSKNANYGLIIGLTI